MGLILGSPKGVKNEHGQNCRHCGWHDPERFALPNQSRPALVVELGAGWNRRGNSASSLFMVRTIDLLTSVYLNFPLALQEIVFAGWLIMKGFNPSAVAA